jgi:S-adenosylmethionine-diacylglycerol 3-amino-3-carboxypropyl transferase
MYFSGIVFNQSWEDPEMDRAALQIVPDRDVVLSITSGGCNCLSLLCLNPKEMICVDANPAQTYLMDLKLAAIRQLDYDDFFRVFNGETGRESIPLYHSMLRDALPASARQFWDRNVQLIASGISRKGKLGLYLNIVRMCLRAMLGEKLIREFFQLNSVEEQKHFYLTKIAPKAWRPAFVKLLRSKIFIYLAGMHPSQYTLIARHIGIERYVRERAEHLLTAMPVRTNYFLAQAAFAKYLDRENVPPYLRESNFVTLKRNVERVSNLTTPLGEYLATKPNASIDKFSLLDIGDWMDAAGFTATLQSVVRVASEGARFVYRSTVPDMPPPKEVEGMIEGEPDLARRLLQTDRSGVYSGFYVYRVVRKSR